ncbi:hypothetical protein [Crocosphaera sp. Alani8]|uniref:hypothetical protein n=1 Tax=Crocosphaera sp. Alani8 TaxID=3038952 RepID=UPI00313B02B6
MNKNVYQLDEQQKQLCLSFVNKWKNILFSTKSLDRQKVKQAVNEAYTYLSLPRPKIIFCISDSDILNFISLSDLTADNYINLYSDLVEILRDSMNLGAKMLKVYLENPGVSSNFFNLTSLFEEICYSKVFETIYDNENKIGTDYNFTKLMEVEFGDINVCEYDFFIEGLKYDCKQAIWYILKSLAQECPYIISLQETCFVIERPSDLGL